MTQNIQEPTIDDHGDEVHPAFARASVAQISHGGGKHGGAVLFDSEVVHQHTVRLRVETATRKRDLNRDWIHGHKEILEIEMSQAQWASLVSSMNSTGVPVTLRWDHGQIPGLPYQPRMALQMEEIKGAAQRMFDKAQAAMAAYEKAIEEKAGAKVIKERRRELHFALANAEGNMTFAATSLSEYAEDVVSKARADVEAMVLSKAEQLGLDPAHATEVLALPDVSPTGPAVHDVQQPDTWTAECFTGHHQGCEGHTADGELCECSHHDDDAKSYEEQS